MKCSCGGGTRVVDRREEYRRRECVVCGKRFSTMEIVVNRARTKAPTKKRKTRATAATPMAKNTREQVTKNASARRRLEDMRDSMGDGVNDL